MIFSAPPQSGQCWKSISNTHSSSLATHQLGSSEPAVGEYPLMAVNSPPRRASSWVHDWVIFDAGTVECVYPQLALRRH